MFPLWATTRTRRGAAWAGIRHATSMRGTSALRQESGKYLRRPGGASLRSRSTYDPVSSSSALRCIHLDDGPMHRIPGAGH